MRNLNFFDRQVQHLDNFLKAVVPNSHPKPNNNPAADTAECEFSEAERKHAVGLMRINHTGEVCAQGLYNGQALTAKLDDIRQNMVSPADEEIDHLLWCEQRLTELDARTSVFNPAFYLASFAIGAAAGAISDRLSLGFVAATEDQVCKHLDEHLQTLPMQDRRSRAILTQMYEDEERHAQFARNHGAIEFPSQVKGLMTAMSKVMTKTTYRL